MLDLIGWYKPAADTWKFHGGRALFKYPLGTPSTMPSPDRLGQWLSTGTISLPIPGDIWTFGSVWRHHWLSELGERDCDQHAVGRGQPCCWHLAVHRAAPHSRQLSGPRCQECRGWDPWIQGSSGHFQAKAIGWPWSTANMSLCSCVLWVFVLCGVQQQPKGNDTADSWDRGAQKRRWNWLAFIWFITREHWRTFLFHYLLQFSTWMIALVDLPYIYVPKKLFVKSYFKYSQEIH